MTPRAERREETRKNTDVPNGATWVYDHPFFMILNVAIGGAFGAHPTRRRRSRKR